MPCDNRGRDGSDAVASQGTPRIASHNQKLGGGKEGFSSEIESEHGPADTLVLDFWPPELFDNGLH